MNIDHNASVSADERNTLVEEHLWLAHQLAGRMWRRFPTHVERSELIAAAMLGLTEAARRFDPALGVPFAAYAAARVKGEILQVARSADLAPRRLRREIRTMAETNETLTQTLGRKPTIEELADSLHMDAHAVRRRLADAERSSVTSLDRDTRHDGTPIERLVDCGAMDPGVTDPSVVVTWNETRGTIKEAVEHLPEPLRTIVIRTNWGEERLIDIAADMGVSFQRVAQYRLEALRALAAWLSMIDDGVTIPSGGTPGVSRRAAYCSEMWRESTWRSRFERGLDGRAPNAGSAAG